MTTAAVGLLVLGVVVVVGLAALSTLVVARQRRAVARANEVVPGVPSPAPVAWAGSHDPEARLHRRLRDAVASLRAATAGPADVAALDLRVEVEQHALALDRSLVAVAGLPLARRSAPLARATEAVEQVERLAAEAAAGSVDGAADGLREAVEGSRRGLALLAEARTEVERLAAGLEAHPAPGSEPSPGG